MTKKILILTLVGVAAVAVIPAFFPTGPDAGLDAAGFLESGRFAVGAGIIFLGGLLTALTPCVYPLIPITVSVFGARRAESKLKAVTLTSAYVLGMGAVFSALGVVAAKTGALFGSVLTDPRFVVGLAIFLLALASSMFGAFELALPSGLQTKLNSVGGTGVMGAFLMGSVSGFLAAPCTGPVLTGLLAFVAKTQSSALGAGLLFIYALGVGVPFFLIGVFTVRLPKGGEWMEWVKSVLGIALVALAFAYLKDAFVPTRTALAELAAWAGHLPLVAAASLLVAVGLLAGAVHLSFKSDARQFALKTVGVTLVVAALLIRGAAMGAPSTGKLWVDLGLMKAPAKPTFQWNLFYGGDAIAKGTAPFDDVLAKAKAEGHPVMIDFFAEWCAACKELDHKTYVADNVIEESQRFVTVKVDGTNGEDPVEALQNRFGVSGLPTVVFIDSKGEVMKAPRVTGFLAPERFETEMKKVQ